MPVVEETEERIIVSIPYFRDVEVGLFGKLIDFENGVQGISILKTDWPRVRDWIDRRVGEGGE